MGMVWFIEEANIAFSKSTQGRFDLGDGPVSGFLRTARKIGSETSVFVIDQTPSMLNEATLANCLNFVIFKLTRSQDVREAGYAGGLEPHQLRELCELSEREVVVRLDRCRRALKLQVDVLRFPKPLTRAQARARTRPILESIPYVKRAEKETIDREKDGGAHADKGGLPPDERRWYAHFVGRPWELKPDRLKATGLSKDADSRIRAKFEARGCIAFEGKVGAKYKVHGPTPRGVELADALGLAVGSPRGGGMVHECMVVYLQRSLEDYFSRRYAKPANFLRVGVSPTMRGVQPDLTVVRPDGSRFAAQACHRNQPGYEADALLRLHRLALLDTGHPDWIDSVLAVTVNKKHKAAIEKAVKERNEGWIPDKLVVLDFDTALEVDWDDVFESVS